MMADDEKLKADKLELFVKGNMKRFVESYFKKGVTQEALLKRTDALKLFFQEELVEGMRTIDCQSAEIKDILEFYIKTVFPSAQKNSKCKCKCTKRASFVSCFQIDENLRNIFRNFQNMDFSTSEVEICTQCKQNPEVTVDLENSVFFITNEFSTFQNIPKVVILQGRHYKLRAVIEKSHTYFIAHVRRPNQKWYTFDHTNKGVQPSCFFKEMNIRLLCFSLDLMYDEFTYQHILANSHELSYDGKKINVVNACAVNSVFHCLLCLFMDSPNLFKQNSSGELIEFFTEFARKCQQTEISSPDLRYELRYKILKSHFTESQSEGIFGMDCWTNVRGILELLIGNQYPSLTIWCDCLPKVETKFSVIDVDFKKLTKFGLNSLKKCIKLPIRFCDVCKKNLEKFSIGDFFFVDVEPIHFQTGELQFSAKEIFVTEISQELRLDKDQYISKGVIEFVNGNHYIANCRRSNNQWYNIDDIRQTIISTSKLIPHILMYAKNI